MNNSIVIRFAGDSGDGIQAIGLQFTRACERQGAYAVSMPDFPAEIRAPAGTTAGVSSYQVAVSNDIIYTPGDFVDVLVAFNSAALEVNLKNINADTVIIADEQDKYKIKNNMILAPINKLTMEALKNIDLQHSKKLKCKNMFALGIVSWVFDLDLGIIKDWVANKFKDNNIVLANNITLDAGFNYSESIEIINKVKDKYHIEFIKKNTDINVEPVSGNKAFSLALIKTGELLNKKQFMAGYPITPASDILAELIKSQNSNLIAMQVEDEISAISMAIGAVFGGSIGLTATSGPGLDLKAESLGFAIVAELPIVIIDVQRAGPSTGMPTKPEQSDLLTAVAGRHGESKTVVLAAKDAADCFWVLLDAYNIAINYMIPVIVLSDAILANSLGKIDLNANSEIIKYFDLSKFKNHINNKSWIVPGEIGKEYRLGSLEHDYNTGNISHDAKNHEKMTAYRQSKLDDLSCNKNYNNFELIGDKTGDVLVVTWGSNYGVALSAVTNLQTQGYKISMLQLRFLYPIAKNLIEYFKNFSKIIIVELNTGQLKSLLQAEFGIEIFGINKVQGHPFKVFELEDELGKYLGNYNARVIEKRF